MTPSSQWSGGEVQLTSGAFSGAGLPVLVAGAETLAVRRISDSVVAAVVPLGSTGAVALSLVQGGHTFPLDPIQRVGFSGGSTVSPGFYGELVVTWSGGTPIIVGAGDPGGQARGPVQSLDVGTMAITPYAGIFGAEYYGVSPTFRPNEFVVSDSVNHASVWRLWPTPALVDSAPLVYAQLRHLARLSDSVWLRTGAHNSNSYVGTTGVFSGFGLSTESVWSVFISPTGALATTAVASGQPGVQVFDAHTGDTLYTLGTGFRHSQWAAFSPDGADIYFLGGLQSGSVDSLIRVTGTTGQLLAGTGVSNGINVATDPVKPLVYVESLADSTPTILVLDAATLALVGKLPAPAVAGLGGCNTNCFEGAIAVDRSRNKLHVIWSQPSGGFPSAVWSYDLVP
jgi:hypothetical protein